MWKKLRKKSQGDIYRYTNEFVQLDVQVLNEEEKVTFIYFPESNGVLFARKATCGCQHTGTQNHLMKLVKRRPYRGLSEDDRFEMLKKAFSELLSIEEAFIHRYEIDDEISYNCSLCSCSRCGDYLDSCNCRCQNDHLMKECSCTCTECHKTLTSCECWCPICGDSVHSVDHDLNCDDWDEPECSCCPCCGCTCDEYDEDYTAYDEHDEEDYDNEENDSEEEKRPE